MTASRAGCVPGLVLALVCFSLDVHAHFVGLSDASIEVASRGVRVIHTLPRSELEELGITGNGQDGKAAALARVREGWRIVADGTSCGIDHAAARAMTAIDALQFALVFDCPPDVEQIDVHYDLAAAFAEGHQTLARIYLVERPMTWRFDRTRPVYHVPVGTMLQRSGHTLPAGFRGDDPNAGLGTAAGPDVMPETSRGRDASRDDGGTMARAFVGLGIRHILEGPDHIAFVLGLVLVPIAWRRLVVCITLFTLAHSITLALSYYRVIAVPPGITEPLIALSIVAIGLENLFAGGAHAGGGRYREATVFAFGLVHGIGLSYQIAALPIMTAWEGVTRLALFNVGVEIGQLIVVAAVILPVKRALGSRFGGGIVLAGGVALVGIGTYWCLTRVLGT